MKPNRVFFPQALLDTWISDERAELAGDELFLRDEGRRYRMEEGFHVVRIVAGEDRDVLVGKVKTREQLKSMGAELFEGSMILQEQAYDVTPGFVGEPVPTDGSTPTSGPEEDLLAQYLLRSL